MLDTIEPLLPNGVLVGATDLGELVDARDAIVERVASGRSGGLGFVFRDPETASDPRRSFPWAASIVVLAVPYLRHGDGVSGGGETDDPVRPVARFADGDRYADLRRCLDIVARTLGDAGHRTEIVFDDDRLVDRAIAQRAGLGWAGKSTLMITPSAGPWVLIGSVVTDAVIPATAPMQRTCGSCTACIPACPTGAIVAPGVLDARRCLAAVLQRPGPIPRSLRHAVGGRVYGCDDCLVACPPGDKVIASLDVGPAGSTARDIVGMSDQELDRLVAHWYVPRRAYRHVRRNAIVALGNVGDVTDIPVLIGFLGHPDALLRSHAAWALGSIGGSVAEAALEQAKKTERDAGVLDEITSAMP